MSYLSIAKKAEQKLRGKSQIQSTLVEETLPPRAWVVEEIWDGAKRKALLICSALLEDHLWLILDRAFTPNDGLACYYAEEIPHLKNKSLEDLRMIHKVKLAFPGCRVIQEGDGSS